MRGGGWVLKILIFTLTRIIIKLIYNITFTEYPVAILSYQDMAPFCLSVSLMNVILVV